MGMPLLKARPIIRLRVPTEIRAGRVFLAIISLDCTLAVDVAYVEIAFRGTERWTYGRPLELARYDERLCEHTQLPKGRTELHVYVPVPKHAPPSYLGASGRIDYELVVVVGMIGWPNAEAAFEIKVVPPASQSPETMPTIAASSRYGPQGMEAYAELSLAADWTRVGDFVRGAYALSNVAHNRYTSVTISVREQPVASPMWPPIAYHVDLSRRSVEEGQMVPFEFMMPADATPSFDLVPRPHGNSGLVALAYELVMTVKHGWDGVCTVRRPFRLLPRSSSPYDAPLRIAPPTVGSDRLRPLWESIGAEHGLRYEGQALHGRFGRTHLVVRRHHRGRDGIYLVATLQYPELHLGLHVGPPSVRSDVRLGDDAWDAAHSVRGRDPEQVRHFILKLFLQMRGATITAFDDRVMHAEIRDARQTRSSLSRFVRAAVALAARFEQVREDVPPPTPLAPALPEWRELASKLNAPLETARMRIDGELGGLSAHVRVELAQTWLAIRPAATLDAQHRFVWTPQKGPVHGPFSGELAELVRMICTGASELHIEPDRIALSIPKVLGLDPTLTAAIAERRLDRMAQLATVLRGHVGPYR